MEIKKKKLYIFDSDGTLYDDRNAGNQFSMINTDYISQKLSVSKDDVALIIKTIKQKYNTDSATIACIKEFGFDFDDFVSETYLRISLEYISVNKNIVNYLQEPGIEKIVFTGSPRAYALKVLTTLSIHNCFKEIFGMKEIGLREKKDQNSFKFISENFIKDNYDEIYFWDNEEENRRLGLIYGWIPVVFPKLY